MAQIPENYFPPKEYWPKYVMPEEFVMPDNTNLAYCMLDRHIDAGRGKRPAVIFGDRIMSYAELQEASCRIASSLADLGVEKQDRVAIRMVNCPEALAVIFAMMRLGAIPVPMSPLWSKDEIGFTLNNAEAKYIVVSAPLMEEVEKAKDKFQYTKNVIVVGGNPKDWEAKGYLTYASLLDKGDSKVFTEKVDVDDIGVILYTSGTTGPPKGCIHFVKEILCESYLVNKYVWRLVEGDILGGSAPVSFAAGFGTFALIPFYAGASVCLIGKFAPDVLLETVQKHKVTVLTGLPTAYRALLRFPDFDKYDISSLRMATTGGDALGVETFNAWLEKTGQPIYEGLGATEMVHLITSNAVNMMPKAGSIGVAIPGFDIKVLDENGNECKPGEVGKLTVIGPTGPLYWKPYADDERLLKTQKESVTEGRAKLGDAVYMDEDGYIFFVSRESDMIKSSGYRIGPAEVEDALKKHPAVANAGVIGSPDPLKGEITKAYVILKQGHSASEELAQEIVESCKEYIAIYKLPRAVSFCDQLPVTPTGKLLRRILKEWDKEDKYPTIRIS